jgi:hypothetical protein
VWGFHWRLRRSQSHGSSLMRVGFTGGGLVSLIASHYRLGTLS